MVEVHLFLILCMVNDMSDTNNFETKYKLFYICHGQTEKIFVENMTNMFNYEYCSNINKIEFNVLFPDKHDRNGMQVSTVEKTIKKCIGINRNDIATVEHPIFVILLDIHEDINLKDKEQLLLKTGALNGIVLEVLKENNLPIASINNDSVHLIYTTRRIEDCIISPSNSDKISKMHAYFSRFSSFTEIEEDLNSQVEKQKNSNLNAIIEILHKIKDDL